MFEKKTYSLDNKSNKHLHFNKRIIFNYRSGFEIGLVK